MASQFNSSQSFWFKKPFSYDTIFDYMNIFEWLQYDIL